MKSTFSISQKIGPETVRHPMFEALGIQVDMLRLDRIHPLVSGNKWLKLSGWLEDEAMLGKAGIATTGGPWSNHLHAVAAYCHMMHLPCRLYVQSYNEVNNAMISDLKQWGAQLIWVAKNRDGNHMQIDALEQGYHWVPMGGDGPEGVKGVADFLSATFKKSYDAGWCAVGTGTTLLGAIGSAIPVRQWVGYCPGFGQQSMNKLRAAFSDQIAAGRMTLLNDRELAFGQSNAELIAGMNDFYDQTGIGTDLVYTGRMICHLLRMLAEQPYPAGSRLLVLHTGGLQGNRSVVDNALKY